MDPSRRSFATLYRQHCESFHVSPAVATEPQIKSQKKLPNSYLSFSDCVCIRSVDLRRAALLDWSEGGCLQNLSASTLLAWCASAHSDPVHAGARRGRGRERCALNHAHNLITRTTARTSTKTFMVHTTWFISTRPPTGSPPASIQRDLNPIPNATAVGEDAPRFQESCRRAHLSAKESQRKRPTLFVGFPCPPFSVTVTVTVTVTIPRSSCP